MIVSTKCYSVNTDAEISLMNEGNENSTTTVCTKFNTILGAGSINQNVIMMNFCAGNNISLIDVIMSNFGDKIRVNPKDGL